MGDSLRRRHRPRLVRLPIHKGTNRRGQLLAAQPMGRPIQCAAPRRAVPVQAQIPCERYRWRRLLRVLRRPAHEPRLGLVRHQERRALAPGSAGTDRTTAAARAAGLVRGLHHRLHHSGRAVLLAGGAVDSSAQQLQSKHREGTELRSIENRRCCTMARSGDAAGRDHGDWERSGRPAHRERIHGSCAHAASDWTGDIPCCGDGSVRAPMRDHEGARVSPRSKPRTSSRTPTPKRTT